MTKESGGPKSAPKLIANCQLLATSYRTAVSNSIFLPVFPVCSFTIRIP